jgi:hypothetical protein
VTDIKTTSSTCVPCSVSSGTGQCSYIICRDAGYGTGHTLKIIMLFDDSIIFTYKDLNKLCSTPESSFAVEQINSQRL